MTDEKLLSKLRAEQESSPHALETNEGPEGCDEEGSQTEYEEEDDGGEEEEMKARKIPKWIEICNSTADGILSSHPVEELTSRKRCTMKSGCWYNKLTDAVRQRDFLPWHCVTCKKGFHE